MTERELLARVEQQAVEIAGLKAQLESLHRCNAELKEQQPRMIYQSMSKAAVNCGSHYGCCLAVRYLESLNNKVKP